LDGNFDDGNGSWNVSVNPTSALQRTGTRERIPPYGGVFVSTELQQLNEQNKAGLWAERIAVCRNSGQSVKAWCKERGICEGTYYKWQKKIFTMA